MPDTNETTDTEAADPPEPTEGEQAARNALIALVEAMDLHMGDDVLAGNEPQAWHDACKLLGRNSRRGAILPAHVREDGTYSLVAVFSRKIADDKDVLEANRMTPAELLADELGQGSHEGGFFVVEPSVEQAKGFSDSLPVLRPPTPQSPGTATGSTSCVAGGTS